MTATDSCPLTDVIVSMASAMADAHAITAVQLMDGGPMTYHIYCTLIASAIHAGVELALHCPEWAMAAHQLASDLVSSDTHEAIVEHVRELIADHPVQVVADDS